MADRAINICYAEVNSRSVARFYKKQVVSVTAVAQKPQRSPEDKLLAQRVQELT